MASTTVKSNKMMRRSESKKSHSWWWNSHISPKNSKWLQENLEEMDQNVKQMLKLIEEDADSFAKRAEMYYQKRPELINLVEEFYRMYRALAERYDHVTGELRKSIPSDLLSQSSGISDVGSEPPSARTSPDRRPRRRPSIKNRAAGFEFFLGTAGSGMDNKEGTESSTLDSESDSDDSSVGNYSGTESNEGGQGLQQRIMELESELGQVKEKLRMQREEIFEGSEKSSDKYVQVLHAKIAEHEEELRMAAEKIKSSEEEIARLKNELQNYNSLEIPDNLMRRTVVLDDETNSMEDKLHDAEKEVASLKQEVLSNGSSIKYLEDQLGSAHSEISEWKVKHEKEKREVSKLEDRLARYKSNLAERDQEIRALKEAMSNAEKSLSEENEQLKAEVTRVSEERNLLVGNLKKLGLRCQSLEEEIRGIKDGKEEKEVTREMSVDSLKKSDDDNAELLAKLAAYEEELRMATEKIILSGEEITRLTDKLQKYNSLETPDSLMQRIQMLEEELTSMEDELHASEKEVVSLRQEVLSNGSSIQHLQGQLKAAQNEISEWKAKLEKERRSIKLAGREDGNGRTGWRWY